MVTACGREGGGMVIRGGCGHTCSHRVLSKQRGVVYRANVIINGGSRKN